MAHPADLTEPAVRPFRELVRRLDADAQFRRAWPLTGGVSATVTAVELARPGAPLERVVVRQHGEADRREKPDLARTEFGLLQLLHARGVPVAAPVLLDESRTLFPASILAVAYVDGETDFTPADPRAFIAQAATALAWIHAVREHAADTDILGALPRLDLRPGPPPPALDDSLQEGRIRAALAGAAPQRVNPAGLLHGDYWPGNWLWRDGTLVAVIDWENALVGDPLADVGNCRLELLWALGAEAMTEFTGRYLAQAPIAAADLPYWDLVAALRPCGKLATWGLDPTTERRMRERHQAFVGRALAQLAAG